MTPNEGTTPRTMSGRALLEAIRSDLGEQAPGDIGEAAAHRFALRIVAIEDEAVGRLRAIEDAAREVADRSPIDQDGETLDVWCHYCEKTDGHTDQCEWAVLREALR